MRSLSRRRLRLSVPVLFFAVPVNIGNNDLEDDDEGHCEEHAGRTENLAAEDDAEDDGDRVQVKRFADERRVDDVVVGLGKDNVEDEGLDRELRYRRGGHNDAERGGDGRPEHRDELADGREQGKDGGVGQPHKLKEGEDEDSRRGAHNQLTADVGAQGAQQIVKETDDTRTRAVGEEIGQPYFDLLAVLEKIKGDKDDDDEVDDLAECTEQERERGAQSLAAEAAQAIEQVQEFVLNEDGVREQRQLLDARADVREFCDKALQRRNDGAREERDDADDDENKEENSEHSCDGAGLIPALHKVNGRL